MIGKLVPCSDAGSAMSGATIHATPGDYLALCYLEDWGADD